MKTNAPFRSAAPLALLALVSACNSQPETLGGGTEEVNATQAAADAKVELPPMVMASHTYRCKDNSLVKVEFMSNKTAIFYATPDAKTGTTLNQPPEGGPYTADGYSVSGPDAEVSLTAPGKATQSCKA